MKYDFDKVYERAEKDSMKWAKPNDKNSIFYSPASDIVSMWIADMDIATPECVINAIKERLEHPLFGYFDPSEEYYNGIINWHKTRYNINYEIKSENLMYQNSVLGAVSSFIKSYSMAGECILVNSPVYNGFIETIEDLGRTVYPSPLVLDENDIYRIDFEDLESKIINKGISVYVFCSPHNPSGRVWEKWELEKVVDICYKHNVKLLSDEIWSDFIMDKNAKQIPIFSLGDKAKEISMAMYAPSKTFNIASIVGAYSLIFNSQIKSKIKKAAASTHYNEPNVLSCHALVGGYENGADWVDEMTSYIRGNQEYICDYINKNLKGVKAYLPQATYLMWIDFSSYCKENNKNFDDIYKELIKTGVIFSDGKDFYGENSARVNVACPRSLCVKAMEGLQSVL